MAHFAELDENNMVKQVVVTDNNAPGEGYDWLIETFGGTWVKTSYNASIRKNFAGIGFIYDAQLDAFIPPKPYESWILNESTCQWNSPIPYPTDGLSYAWNEQNTNWQFVELAEFER